MVALDLRRGLTDPKDVAHPLRWGIIGTGRISEQWVETLAATEGATVTAVAAREHKRAEEFARRNGVARAYGDYADLVAAEDVDIVYVGTITPLHTEHTLLALNAGKHVLCEKPLALNAADARTMYEAADAAGVMLQDGMWTRFFPAVEHARLIIEEGGIGDVRVVQADFSDPIYSLQFAPLAFGADTRPEQVVAAGTDTRGAVLSYRSSRLAVLTFPTMDMEFPETTEIIGTEGRITLDRHGHCPTRMTLHDPPSGGVPSRYRTDNAPAPRRVHEYPLPHVVAMRTPYPNQQGFLHQAEAVHRCVAAGLRQCPQYSKEDSLHAMDLLDQV